MNGLEKSDLNRTEEKYRDRLQNKIHYCIYCQPYDDGEAVWIHGERIDLYDLMDEMGVPEKSKEKIAEHLFCPHCGNDTLDLMTDVGLKSTFEIAVEKHFDEANKKYGKQVAELERMLEQFPLLACQHSFAKKIYKEVQTGKIPKTEISGNFFRARKVESSEVIRTGNMYEPPVGKSGEGRFNHAGQSHLYLSNDKETAMREVCHDEESVLVWIQQFKIENIVPNILDLTFDWTLMTTSTSSLLISFYTSKAITRSERNKDNWKPDYFLTRFLMDCAKSCGYSGIKYHSAKDEYSFDIVLFHPEDIQLKPVGDPGVEICLNKQERKRFTDDLLDF